jgi:DNA repair protein RadC
MANYRPEPEVILLAGLDLGAVKRKRRKVCASKKGKYAWMRYDTCTEITEDADVEPIRNSLGVSKFLHDTIPFAGRGVEYFMVMGVDQKNKPIAVALVSKGGRSSSIVDASVVFQSVLLSGASNFIIAHNHPSGSSDPSPEDMAITRKLREGARSLGMNLLDHLVLTDDPSKYTSFLDAGIMGV